MFCPSCGLEERQLNQFCRACGADLRPVRGALERPDSITTSAITAREEIGRAFAAKIRETQSASELKIVADSVLPEIEKFLESPAEKRLRRMRSGAITSSIGFGGALGFMIASTLMGEQDVFFFVGVGIVLFFIGLGMILNALFFTVPKKSLSDKFDEAQNQRQLDVVKAQTNELVLPPSNEIFSSVTEDTTHRLQEKQPIPRG